MTVGLYRSTERLDHSDVTEQDSSHNAAFRFGEKIAISRPSRRGLYRTRTLPHTNGRGSKLIGPFALTE